MQAAVDHQLTTLVTAHPSYRVALIAFSDEVSTSIVRNSMLLSKCTHAWMMYIIMKVIVIADGKGESLTVAGDRLRDMDELVEIGTKIPLPSAVKDTRENLSKKIFE